MIKLELQTRHVVILVVTVIALGVLIFFVGLLWSSSLSSDIWYTAFFWDLVIGTPAFFGIGSFFFGMSSLSSPLYAISSSGIPEVSPKIE